MIKILGITLIFTHLAAGDLFLYDDRFQPALGLDYNSATKFIKNDTTESSAIDTVAFF
jgi:hypothetical protein